LLLSRRSLCSLFLLALLAAGSSAALAAGRRSIVSKVAPVYPELARRMHVGGVVVLQLTVAPDGSVTDTKVESGHALLGSAAQEAVRRWRFEPAADTTSMTVDVNFAAQ
jgi:TonB family protein